MTKEAIELFIETLKQYNEEIPNEEDVLEYNSQYKFKWLKPLP